MLDSARDYPILPNMTDQVPSKPRLTWRKGPYRSGMMRLANTYHLCRGDERLATAQEITSGWWFWYGGNMNTSGNPTDLATAKRDAKAYMLSLAP